MATDEAIRELHAKMAEERAALLRLVEGMTEEAAEQRPPDDLHGEEGWSVKEQLSHLAEMETSYRAWVQRAVAEDNPDLSVGTVRDPVAYPLEVAEQHTVAEHRAELEAQRARTLEVMAGLTPADYDRTARSAGFGKLTVLQYLRSYYRHDRMHEAQIQRRKSDYQPKFLGREPDQRRRTPGE